MLKFKPLATALILLSSTSCSYVNMVFTHEAETVYEFEKIRPANMAISGDGRVFVTGHPIVDSKIKLIEIISDGTIVVYPNDEYANATKKESLIGATIGIHIDSKNNLWILDLANRQFIAWNIDKNALYRIVKLPASALKDNSFVQDFALDEKNNRIIIADMTQADLKSAPEPAFVVVELDSEKVFRVAERHPSMMPDFKGGLGLNPIAIDPNFDYLYFGAMHAKKIYRVKTSHFAYPDTLADHIEYYAPKSYSDGIKVDADHNVYVTDIEKQAIGMSNPQGYKIIAKLPKDQSWPDGLALWGGDAYAVVNQLNRTPALNNGVDDSVGKFIIIKTPLKTN